MLQDSPRSIPSPAGGLAQSQFRDQVLRGARRNAELLRDHAGGGDRSRQDVVEQRRHPGGGASARQLAGEQCALVKPAIMILRPASAAAAMASN